MADRLEQLIEMECADALLDSGVSVPLKRWKLPWLKRPVEVRVTMKRPRLRGQILLAREYLKTGVKPDWQPKDKTEELAFVAEHGKAVSRLLAYTVCRGYVSRHVGIGVTAWVLRNFCGVALSDGHVPNIRASDGHEGFYAYYQLDSAGEPDDSETEPGKEGELRTRYEGSHSPFGFVWQIASATGWSVDYILDGVNYQTLIMMLSDAPRYVRKKQGGGNGAPRPEHSAEDEANDIVGFFQSKLE